MLAAFSGRVFRSTVALPHTTRVTVRQLLTANGIKVSHSSTAQQLIVFCHAGWKPISRVANTFQGQSGDPDAVKVPVGATLYFYVNEGLPELGFSVFQEIMRHPELAINGLRERPGISLQEAQKLDRAPTADELGSNVGVKAQFRRAPRDIRDIRMPSAPLAGVDPHDYALYYHKEVDHNQFAKHLRGEYPQDVDLATIAEGISHKRHLSDVFALVRGHPYRAIHFAGCRVRRD